MIDIDQALEKDDLETAEAVWKKLHKWEDLHMHMEEGRGNEGSPIGMFAMLDRECGNVVKDADLRQQHTTLQAAEKAVQEAFEKKDGVKEAYAQFRKENLAHLELEEKIMMPNVQKLAQSGKPLKMFMQKEILPLVPPEELKFFIQFASEILQNHEDNMPRVRVFNHALWAAATPEQWKEWQVWIKEVLPEEKYKEVDTAVQAWKEHMKKQNEAKTDTVEHTLKDHSAVVDSTPDKVDKDAKSPAPEAGGCCIIL